MVSRFIMTIILCLVWYSYGFAKEGNTDLRTLLQKEELNMINALKQNKAWYIRCHVSSRMKWEGRVQQSNSDIEVIIGTYFRYSGDENTKIWVDTADVFTVDMDQKIIMHGRSSKANLATSVPGYAGLFTDSLLQNFKLMVQDTVNAEVSKEGRTVRYKLEAIHPEKNAIAKLEYHFSFDLKILRKVSVEYNAKLVPDMVGYSMTIKEKGQQSALPQLPIRNKFLTKDNKLKNDYNRFTYRNLNRKH